MKTAIQELIDILTYHKKILEKQDSIIVPSTIYFAIREAEKLLEKEKEQIINSHNNAVISPYTELYVYKIQGKSPITKGEDYYNQKYNQNL